MPWLWLKAMPWGTILATAPTVVHGARKLLGQRRRSIRPPAEDEARTEPAALVHRIRAMEMRAQQMAERIESLAGGNEELAAAVQALRLRAVWSFRLAILLAIVVAGLAFRLLLG